MDQQLQPIFESVVTRNPGEAGFHQAVREVFESLEPVIKKGPGYLKGKILERICEPECQVIFRIPWVDDRGAMQVNHGFRAEFSSALSPYKGGLRFHPSVYLGIIKFPGFEQIFKNSLTGLPIGSGKGDSDFNLHGGSDAKAVRFCQSLMIELYRYLGEYTNMSAGNVGVGGRETGYIFGQYKGITSRHEFGALTGRGLDWGRSLIHTKATGYGVVTFTQKMLKTRGDAFDGKHVTISGSGNVAIYAIEKVQQLSGRVVTCSDSSGYIVSEAGIDVGLLKQIEGVERGRITDYASRHGSTELGRTDSIWDVAVDVTLSCATQNELNGEHTATLIRNGVKTVVEGANMPITPESIHAFQEAGVLFAPGRAANAGGVATSGLEMQQNAMHDSWTFEYTEERLTSIMRNIHGVCATTAEEYDAPGDYVVGANTAGFTKIASAMQAFGLV